MAHATLLSAVSAQTEEYLEAVCRLRDRGEAATPTELARELGIAPPSVLGMLRRMAGQGLIAYTRQTGARLTQLGEAYASRLRRRHRLAERMLTDLLGLPWDRAHEIACRFEHVIDDEVEDYLQVALQHPSTCPHGNPLEGGMPAQWVPLANLKPGEWGILRQVVDESTAMLEYLAAMRLQPGVRVAVRAVAPGDGPRTVEVLGERHALAPEMAGNLLVERAEVTL